MVSLNNKINKKRFTQLLQELICQKSCDLQNALLLLSQSKSKKYLRVQQAAQNIYDSLKHGNTFTLAIKKCPYINFDPLYISFIGFAERCGELQSTLNFLKDKCIREEENTRKVIEASLYPLFVVIISVAGAAGLVAYSNSFADFNGLLKDFSKEFYSSFYMSFCFLIFFCTIAFFILRKMLGTNKLYEAFLASGFLINRGESLANAVNDAVNILGYETREGQLFAQAGKKLSYGLSLHKAFELDSLNYSLRQELQEAFFYAENTGGKNQVFEKIALWLNAKDEKRRYICLKLIEPFFIFGTGIFLLVFLMNLVLPIFWQNTMIF